MRLRGMQVRRAFTGNYVLSKAISALSRKPRCSTRPCLAADFRASPADEGGDAPTRRPLPRLLCRASPVLGIHLRPQLCRARTAAKRRLGRAGGSLLMVTGGGVCGPAGDTWTG
jgi:hypothetical protein